MPAFGISASANRPGSGMWDITWIRGGVAGAEVPKRTDLRRVQKAQDVAGVAASKSAGRSSGLLGSPASVAATQSEGGVPSSGFTVRAFALLKRAHRSSSTPPQRHSGVASVGTRANEFFICAFWKFNQPHQPPRCAFVSPWLGRIVGFSVAVAGGTFFGGLILSEELYVGFRRVVRCV